MNYQDKITILKQKIISQYDGEMKELIALELNTLLSHQKKAVLKETTRECTHIVDKLMFRLQRQDMDYFKRSTRYLIEQAIDVIYNIGFEAGRKDHSKGVRRAVIAYKDGKEIPYKSITDAALEIDRHCTNISFAIKNNTQCAGYKWKYA